MLAPAVVVTPIYKAFIDEDAIDQTLQDGFNSFHPLGRVGRPEDEANTIDFLFLRILLGSQGRLLMLMVALWQVGTERSLELDIVAALDWEYMAIANLMVTRLGDPWFVKQQSLTMK